MLNLSCKYQCTVCLTASQKNLALICPSPKSFICNLPDSERHITRVSLSRSLGTGRRESWGQDCCYFPMTTPHFYCLSTSIPIVFPPCLQKIMKRYGSVILSHRRVRAYSFDNIDQSMNTFHSFKKTNRRCKIAEHLY